jgi:hypothetical protein
LTADAAEIACRAGLADSMGLSAGEVVRGRIGRSKLFVSFRGEPVLLRWVQSIARSAKPA